MATSKPLVVAVDLALLETPEVKELEALGHTIVPLDMQHYDVIVGHKCFRLFRETIKMLDLAIKATRAVKYPKKEKAK